MSKDRDQADLLKWAKSRIPMLEHFFTIKQSSVAQDKKKHLSGARGSFIHAVFYNAEHWLTPKVYISVEAQKKFVALMSKYHLTDIRPIDYPTKTKRLTTTFRRQVKQNFFYEHI